MPRPARLEPVDAVLPQLNAFFEPAGLHQRVGLAEVDQNLVGVPGEILGDGAAVVARGAAGLVNPVADALGVFVLPHQLDVLGAVVSEHRDPVSPVSQRLVVAALVREFAGEAVADLVARGIREGREPGTGDLLERSGAELQLFVGLGLAQVVVVEGNGGVREIPPGRGVDALPQQREVGRVRAGGFEAVPA